MSRTKKTVLVTSGAVVAGCLLCKLCISLLISPTFVERHLEENLNCNVEVAGVSVKLLKREVAVRGLSLTPWDTSREETRVDVGRLELGVKLLPLAARRLETTRFVIGSPRIRARFQENGDFSLTDLFRAPKGTVAGEEKQGDEAEESRERVLPADKNGWLAKLSEARLEEGDIEFVFEKEDLTLTIESVSITIRDLRFDPENLKSLNKVDLDLAGKSELRDREGQLLVRLNLAGSAAGKLFEERTGELKPDLAADLKLGPDSHLDPRVKIVRRIWDYTEKATGKAAEFGIRVGRLPDRINFGGDRRVAVHYREGVATLRAPLSLSAGSWELGLAAASWVETFSGRHEIGVEFLAGGQAGKLAGDWSQKLPEEVRALASERFLANGRVLWRVNSSGQLSDPELDFLSQIPEASELWDDLGDELEEEADRLKEKAKGFLDDLLDF